VVLVVASVIVVCGHGPLVLNVVVVFVLVVVGLAR